MAGVGVVGGSPTSGSQAPSVAPTQHPAPTDAALAHRVGHSARSAAAFATSDGEGQLTPSSGGTVRDLGDEESAGGATRSGDDHPAGRIPAPTESQSSDDGSSGRLHCTGPRAPSASSATDRSSYGLPTTAPGRTSVEWSAWNRGPGRARPCRTRSRRAVPPAIAGAPFCPLRRPRDLVLAEGFRNGLRLCKNERTVGWLGGIDAGTRRRGADAGRGQCLYVADRGGRLRGRRLSRGSDLRVRDPRSASWI